MKCQPVLVDSLKGPTHGLERIESEPHDDKDEDWLQGLIFGNPELLPVQKFDDTFAPLISVVRELPTPSGPVDVLCVSPVGKLTIIETKLWKNPEKHRTVVAQIIDYAKEISRWSYDDLDQAVLKASRREGEPKRSLEQVAHPHLGNAGMTFDDFQERVIANLEKGEFLLLIVGDRISANVALLTEAIHGLPGLNFTLGLIELQLHQLEGGKEWPLLVLPDIVGRTVEKTRGVIRIQYEKEKPKVDVTISKDEKGSGQGSRTTQEIFLQKAPEELSPIYEKWLEAWKKRPKSELYWGTEGFSYRRQVHNKMVTILDAYPEWAVSIVRQKDADQCSATPEQYGHYKDKIVDLPSAANILALGKKYVKHESLTPEALNAILEATDGFAEDVVDQWKEVSGID